MEQKLNLAVFISGRGSNMLSILKACEDNLIPAKIVAVISDKPDAIGLVSARDKGIRAIAVDRKAYKTKADFEQAIQEQLENLDEEIDLICLAGFMRILSANFVSKWENRIINIHPSLLPKYKGLDTHKRALENGDTEAGCTVHIVTAEMDDGPILVQKSVPIQKDDTEETLAQRILEQEHMAYPEAINIMFTRLKKQE